MRYVGSESIGRLKNMARGAAIAHDAGGSSIRWWLVDQKVGTTP